MSFKSRMFNFFVRNGHVFHGKLKKEIFDFNTSIPAFRKRCEQGAQRAGRLPEGVSVKEQEIHGIHAEWLIPAGAPAGKIILYFHGGGYVSGSCNDHRVLISKFAAANGVSCLLFEYRLAPEHPYPAALEDSLLVYQWLLSSGYRADHILFAGESAGGGLCLATLLAQKLHQLPQPVAAVAISPWTDLGCSSDSYRTKNRVSPAPIDSWTVFSKYYRGDKEATEPLISPLYGDLKGLPALYINSAVDDELFEDGEKFYLKAQKAGVDVTFKAGTGMVHCYPLLAPMFREATEAMNEIAAFTRKHLKLYRIVSGN